MDGAAAAAAPTSAEKAQAKRDKNALRKRKSVQNKKDAEKVETRRLAGDKGPVSPWCLEKDVEEGKRGRPRRQIATAAPAQNASYCYTVLRITGAPHNVNPAAVRANEQHVTLEPRRLGKRSGF
eukprot:COSAG06_NODE_3114_length_5840_cov_26.926842_5_plen_124_part_00